VFITNVFDFLCGYNTKVDYYSNLLVCITIIVVKSGYLTCLRSSLTSFIGTGQKDLLKYEIYKNLNPL